MNRTIDTDDEPFPTLLIQFNTVESRSQRLVDYRNRPAAIIVTVISIVKKQISGARGTDNPRSLIRTIADNILLIRSACVIL